MDPALLPSDTAHWRTAARYQLRFYLRTWRFIGLLIFILAVGAIVTLVSIYRGDGGTSGADYLSNSVGNLATFGVIIGAFIGGDAISMDFGGGGTGYYMLVLPIRRLNLLLGRFTAAFLTTAALIVVFYAISLGGATYFWGAAIPWGALVESFGLALLFALAVLATAFFFSSLFKSPALSIVVTILILFLGFLIVDEIVGSTLGVEPWFSLMYAGGVIGLVLEGAPHETATTVMRGHTSITLYTWNPYIWEGAVIMVAYLAVFLVLSAVIYQYRESKG